MIRFSLRDKAPGESQVYSIDWAKYLGQDTLVGLPTATVLEGTIVINELSTPDNHTSDFFIGGGVVGEVARAHIHVETSTGQLLDAEVVLGIR